MLSKYVIKKIKEHIGDRVYVLRQNNELKQEALALELGISRTTLSNIERGKRLPTLEILLKLSFYFQVSCDYFIGTDGILFNDEENDETNLIDVSGLCHRDRYLIQIMVDKMEASTEHSSLID